MEDQIGALGLVLNALVLFNTRYMDAAVNELRADGFDVRDEDVARLSPSCGTTSTCSAGTPSSFPTCRAACVRFAIRTPPTRNDPGSLARIDGWEDPGDMARRYVRRCGQCGMELPKGSGRSRRHCDSACRTRA